MSRIAVALLLVLALGHTIWMCDAGVLGFLGDKTQQLKNDTKVIVVKAEQKIHNLFGRVHEEPTQKPVVEVTSAKTTESTDDVEMTTTVAQRELFRIVPRCDGDEIWDSDTESCVPELG